MQTLRVVTLNIWNRSGPWEHRLEAIRAGIAALSPDVIGLQEVLHPTAGEGPDQAALIAEGLGFRVAYGAAWNAGGIEFGNAILSRFEVAEHRVFPLPEVDSEERRCVVGAHLDTPWGKLPFFVTHLNWRFDEGYIRQAQVKRIAEIVGDASAGATLPAVLVGDFNAEPAADEIRFLRGHCSLGVRSVYFSDAFASAGDGSAGVTFTRRNPFASDLHEPDRRIDYIFVRGPSDRGIGEPLEARVCFDQPFHGVFPSDHFGVTTLLRVA